MKQRGGWAWATLKKPSQASQIGIRGGRLVSETTDDDGKTTDDIGKKADDDGRKADDVGRTLTRQTLVVTTEKCV